MFGASVYTIYFKIYSYSNIKLTTIKYNYIPTVYDNKTFPWLGNIKEKILIIKGNKKKW